MHYPFIHTSTTINVIKKTEGEFDEKYFKNKEANWKNLFSYHKDADLYLKRILLKLNQKNLLDNALLVVMSDHGTGTGEKPGERRYGVYCYDYTIKTFAIIVGKAFPAKVINKMVRTIDLAPTILEVLGISQDTAFIKMQGESLMRVLSGKDKEKWAFSETAGLDSPVRNRPNVFSMRTDKFKLIYNKLPNTKEFYNIEKDSFEEKNLVGKTEIETVFWRKLEEKELSRIIDLYDGGIAFFDNSFGELIDGIKELGLWENTFFIVTADHGEEFLDHGRMGHSDYSFYDELIKVPLLIKSPLHEAREMHVQVRHIDLMPTFLELLGIKANLKTHGKSLVPLLEGTTSVGEKTAFNEIETNLRVIRSVRSEGWKLIKREFMARKVFDKNWRKWLPRYTKKACLLLKENLKSGSKKKKKLTSGVELYNLKNDPYEKENLCSKNRDKLKELENKLKKWVELQNSVILKEPLKVIPKEKTSNQLKGLGYL